VSERRTGGSWIVIVPLAAVAVGYLVFVFLPNRRETAEWEQQLAAHREFLTQAAPLGVAAGVAQGELANTRAYNEHWARETVASDELPRLYARIHALVPQSGAVMTRFDPDRPVSRELLQETTLSLGATGTCEQLLRVLSGIERLGGITWIKEVDLEKGMDGTSARLGAKLVVFSVHSNISDYVDHSD
jgi:Tfp pilus assembly protein PilO